MAGGSFTDAKRIEYTGEDFRFTTKGDALYAIALAWPTNGKLVVKSLAVAGWAQRAVPTDTAKTAINREVRPALLTSLTLPTTASSQALRRVLARAPATGRRRSRTGRFA